MLYDIITGTILGIVAGLTPGIHSNTFAALILLYAANYKNASILIICSAIAYTIADIIPTTLLGVPDEETAIATFPAHEMVLDGRGFEAISLSAISSFFSLILVIPLFFTVIAIANNYAALKSATPYVLLIVSSFLILSEKGDDLSGSMAAWRKRFYALLVFTASGFAGIFALNHAHLAEVNPAGSVLLPLLTGLFGAPVLMQSIGGGSIPPQNLKIKMPDIGSTAKGTISGFIVSLFPGISSGIATSISSFGERSKEGYIAAMSAANTSNALLCFYMLIAAGVARSGAADAIKKLHYSPSIHEVALFSLISGLIALALTLALSRLIIAKISNLNLLHISIAIFLFLIFVIFYFTGLLGLSIFFSTIPVGLAASMLGVKRVNCMGCLIIPVMAHYLSPSLF